MLIYSNTYSYTQPDYVPQLGSQNPEIYYSNEDNFGDYAFVGIEDLVNNFTQNFTGDDTLLGYIPRSKVIYQVKQAIREFTYGMLAQVRVVEFELNDANNIILPPDYVNYVRISWVNQKTGQIQPMSQSRHHPLGTAYLQDNVGDILFDNNGEILEGTTAIEAINDALPAIPNLNDFPNWPYGCFNSYTRYGIGQIWNLDVSRNFNGTFDINDKRIHFGADSVSRIILLEYVSDGLQVLEAEMKVHKFAEQAVYDFVHYNLGRNSIRLPDYEKRNLKKANDTSVRNAKVRLLGIKPNEFIAMWRANKNWIR
jgi:hypothetical protein